jgi:membrane protease subunit HflC
MKRNPLTIGIGVLLIIIFTLWLCVFQVRQSEVVVVTTFGKVTRSIAEPGPYLKAPWPIQSDHHLDQRVQNFEDKFTEGLTQDGFNLLTSVYIGWRITDPKTFFPKFAVSSTPMLEAERGIERLLGNAKSAVIGRHPLGAFISPAGVGNQFVEIESQILEAIRTELKANNYGLDVDFLGFKRLGLPESVTQNVFERMTSERQLLINRSQFEGEAEALKIRSEADRKASELLAAAEAKAREIRGKGEAEAAKSLSVFQQNPELANFIFRIEALETSLKDRSTLIFDQSTPPFDLFRGASTNLLK